MRPLLRILVVAALAAVLSTLYGCGGGEDLGDADDEQPTPPVPCSVDRKACI